MQERKKSWTHSEGVMDSQPEIGDRGAEVAFMRIKDMTIDQEWSL